MERKTQVGMLRISFSVIEEMLNLSEDHKIVDIFVTEKDRQNNHILLKISGPSMPILREGEIITYITSVPDAKNKH